MNKVVAPNNEHDLDADNASLIVDLRGAYLHGTVIDLSGCNLKRIKILTDNTNSDPVANKVDPSKSTPVIIPSTSSQTQKEIWAPVEGYGNRLEVSNTGFMRYADTKRVIRTKSKTAAVQYKSDAGQVVHTNVCIPREVAKHFLPLPEGYSEKDFDHFSVMINDKTAGFAVENLHWSCYSKTRITKGKRKCGVISYRIGEDPFHYDTINEAASILGIPYQKLSEGTRHGGVYIHDGGIHIRREDA